MNKLIVVLCLNFVLTTNCLAMRAHEMIEDGNRRNSTPIQQGSSSMVRLDESTTVEEESILTRPSCLKQAVGYGIKTTIVGSCLLIGGSIGIGVMCGEYESLVCSTLVRTASPMIIGGFMGYVSGEVLGAIAKRKFDKRFQ